MSVNQSEWTIVVISIVYVYFILRWVFIYNFYVVLVFCSYSTSSPVLIKST